MRSKALAKRLPDHEPITTPSREHHSLTSRNPGRRTGSTSLGYKIKDRKTNIYRRGRRQMVTGIVVNVKLNLPRRLRRRLRAAVDHVARGGQPHWNNRPLSSQELEGRLSFLRLVQPAEATKLKHKIAISRAQS